MEKSSNRLLSLLRKVKNWHEQEKNLALDNDDKSNTTSVKEVLEKIANNTAKNYNREKDLSCSIDANINLHVNDGFIETLFTELLDNAFKFSQKGNPVSVGTNIKDSKYSIVIADCGKSNNYDSLINFKPLNKNGRLPQNDPGLGLGLAIVDLLVKSINGELQFEKNSPCGIIVTVSIPIPFDEEPPLKNNAA